MIELTTPQPPTANWGNTEEELQMNEPVDIREQFLEEQKQEMLISLPLSLTTIRVNELERELDQLILSRMELGEESQVATEKSILEIASKTHLTPVNTPHKASPSHLPKAALPTVVILALLGHALVMLMQGLVFGSSVLSPDYIGPSAHLVIFTITTICSAVLTVIFRNSSDDKSYLKNLLMLLVACFAFAFLWKGIPNASLATQLIGIPFLVAGLMTPRVHRFVERRVRRSEQSISKT